MRELTCKEVELVSGGLKFDTSTFEAGLATVGLGLAIVGTGGIAGAVIGTAELADLAIVGGAGLTLSGAGGMMIGSSIKLLED